VIGLERRSGLQLILGHRQAQLGVRRILAGDGLERGRIDRDVLRTDAEEAAYTVKGKDWSKNRLVGFVTWSFP